jgi:hypothetical protein
VTYADCLVRIARTVLGGTERAPLAWTGTLAMAQPAGLETRVRAILDPGTDRRPLDMPGRAGLLAVVSIDTLPIAALRPDAMPALMPHGPVATDVAHEFMSALAPIPIIASAPITVPRSQGTTVPMSSREKTIPTATSAAIATHPADTITMIPLTSTQIAKYINVETALQTYWRMPEHAALRQLANATTRNEYILWNGRVALDGEKSMDVRSTYTFTLYDYPALVARDTALADIFQNANFRPEEYAPTHFSIVMTFSVLLSSSASSADSALSRANVLVVNENHARLATLFTSTPKLGVPNDILNMTQRVANLFMSSKMTGTGLATLSRLLALYKNLGAGQTSATVKFQPTDSVGIQ